MITNLFEAVVLGASGTYPKPGGACTGFLLRCRDSSVLVDAGPGTFANLQRHVDFHELTAVVISHLHLDHILDLFSLYHALRYGRDSRGPTGLEVYGPEGTEEHLRQLLAPYGEGDFGGYFDFHVIRSGDKVGIMPFVFTFKKTTHPVETLAMSADANGRTLVYTADTAWNDGLVAFARNANVLIAEASLQEPDTPASQVHMTAEEAGKLAKTAGVGRLVLTHIVPGLDPMVSLEQAGKHFTGKIIAATDNYVI